MSAYAGQYGTASSINLENQYRCNIHAIANDPVLYNGMWNGYDTKGMINQLATKVERYELKPLCDPSLPNSGCCSKYKITLHDNLKKQMLADITVRNAGYVDYLCAGAQSNPEQCGSPENTKQAFCGNMLELKTDVNPEVISEISPIPGIEYSNMPQNLDVRYVNSIEK